MASALLPQRPATGPLIADHTVVARYADIRRRISTRSKPCGSTSRRVAFIRVSQGQPVAGKDLDARFQVNVTESGTPSPTRISTCASAAQAGATWTTPPVGSTATARRTVTSAQAVQRTKDHLTYANTHSLAIAAMGFGWCWDTTWTNGPGGGIDPVLQVRWPARRPAGRTATCAGARRGRLRADEQSRV